MLKHLHAFLARRGVRELVKFGLVGSFNLIVDLGITNILVLIAHWPAIYAGYTGTLIALTSSFFMNRHWTFRVTGSELWPQFIRFMLINGSGAVINGILYTIFLHQFDWYYNYAKLLAIALSATWNFLGTKYWAFRRQHGSQI